MPRGVKRTSPDAVVKVFLELDSELWTRFKLTTWNTLEGRFNPGQIKPVVEALLRRYLTELAEVEAHAAQTQHNEVLE